jgi:hypothetical protein
MLNRLNTNAGAVQGILGVGVTGILIWVALSYVRLTKLMVEASHLWKRLEWWAKWKWLKRRFLKRLRHLFGGA